MERTINLYCNWDKKYSIDKNLEISVFVDRNTYNINPEFLFNMAARKNLKREFLFVSKVIGKHLPMEPLNLELIGALLARSWLEKREKKLMLDTDILVETFKTIQSGNKISLDEVREILDEPIALEHKTLFIGFAETATGLAQAVFNSFSNAAYIHTTREAIETIDSSVLFREEHSHAVDHELYPLESEFLNNYEDIVLVDDELTTGNTALNLIKKLNGTSFGILSILDWREKEAVELYENYKDKKLRVCYLMKGHIIQNKVGEIVAEDHIAKIDEIAEGNYKEVIFGEGTFLEGYLMESGRFGLTSRQHQGFKKRLFKMSKEIEQYRVTGNCLCLGSEEFIYIPCAISKNMGDNVYFQSSTRSPIYAKNMEYYAIKDKVTFKTSGDELTPKFLYNIPNNFYSQAFMFTEKPLSKEKKKEFFNIFKFYGIDNIVFVSFKEGGKIIE